MTSSHRGGTTHRERNSPSWGSQRHSVELFPLGRVDQCCVGCETTSPFKYQPTGNFPNGSSSLQGTFPQLFNQSNKRYGIRPKNLVFLLKTIRVQIWFFSVWLRVALETLIGELEIRQTKYSLILITVPQWTRKGFLLRAQPQIHPTIGFVFYSGELCSFMPGFKGRETHSVEVFTRRYIRVYYYFLICREYCKIFSRSPAHKRDALSGAGVRLWVQAWTTALGFGLLFLSGTWRWVLGRGGLLSPSRPL